ncbi:MAG TPA: type IV pilus assembly protein PilM [Tepidisphaeraceae bacterium]|jgi:type IV pilus assembly protein PilM
MATPRFAWGIDIGNRALKAVRLVRDGDGVRVDDFEFIEHETILSQAGDNKEQLIQTALANFTQRHTFKGGVVSVGVSGQNSFARFVKLPPVEEKKVPEIVRFEAIQQIPFPLDDVEWSYQLFREEDNPEIEVGIFAMRRELVNQHIGYFTDFDLNVQTVQMNPLAVYNALQFDGRFNDGVAMVVDVGTDNTDLLIANNQSIWMRSIPIGGSNFTEALIRAFKLNAVKAEDLKRNAATSKYARQIFQHMRPVFADLVAEIQRSIGFYSSVHRDAKITKIYALGGTFKLPGLQKYLQQNLQLPVERIDGFSAGAPADPKQAATFGDNLLSVVGAYGLAVQAMGGAMVNSSLLPRAIQKERVWQEKTKWFGLAAALFVGGVTVVGARLFFERLQYTSKEATRSHNAEILKRASDLSSKWTTVQSAGEPERVTIANLQTLNEGKTLWPLLLTDLVNAIPQPPEPLATALKNGDIDAIKKVPRGQRQVIQINELISQYDPALAPKLADAAFRPVAAPPLTDDSLGSASSSVSFGAPASADPAAAAAAADPAGKGRGFILTMRVTCPLEQAVEFIERDLQNALQSVKPTQARPSLQYAVRKVWILQRNQVSRDAARMATLTRDHTIITAAKAAKAAGISAAGAGMSPGGMGEPGERPPMFPGYPSGAAPVVPGGPSNEAFNDRLTGESVLNDWLFEIAVAVELDPAPWVKPDPAATPADPNAPAPAAPDAAAAVTP